MPRQGDIWKIESVEIQREHVARLTRARLANEED